MENPYNSVNMEQVLAALDLSKIPWKKPLLLLVGVLLIGWLLNTPPGLLGKADAVGYAVCHRISLRSFHLGDRVLPLCARCSGMYLGAVLGLLFQIFFGSRRAGMPPLRVLLVLAGFVGAFGVDGVNSYLHLFPGAPALYEPQNWLRLLTGSGMGLVIAALLFPAFNQTVWQDPRHESALSGFKQLAALVGLTLLLDIAVLTENWLILYPLAIISAAGVLVILSMVYSMIWLMLLRSENRILRFGEMLLPLVAGFGFALLQIAVLDGVRFLFTGTWDGFHLG